MKLHQITQVLPPTILLLLTLLEEDDAKEEETESSLFYDLPVVTSSVAVAKKCENNNSSDSSNYFQGGESFSSEEIHFSGNRKNCCICFIDMMNSTKIVSQLTQPQISKYYSIFLNSTAIIAKNFGATIIKNAGDCLIYYFPKTTDKGDNPINDIIFFKDVIDCGITMIAAHRVINSKLHGEKLPTLDYRISADYGKVEFAKSSSSQAEDIFGSTVNVCAKINSKAIANGMVIGKRLRDILRSVDEYVFEEVGKYGLSSSSTDNEDYAIYSVTSRQKQTILNPFIRMSESMATETKTAYTQLKLNRNQEQERENTNNILLVEDEADVLFTYERFLQSEGYHIDAYTDPLKALEKFENTHNPNYYSLMVSDIKMPNLNGLELYNKIKSKNKDIKVLFISALEAAEMLVNVLPGLTTTKNVIKKPVDKENLVAAVKSLIASYS